MGALLRLLVYAAALGTLTGLVTLVELDELLKARHPPGAPSYGVGDLAGSLFRPDLHQVEEVVDGSWRVGAPPEFTRPTTIVHAHVIVDCFFALAYAGLLAVLAYSLRRALDAGASESNLSQVAVHRLFERDVYADADAVQEELADLVPRITRYRDLARLALVLAPILFGVDLVENVLQSIAVENPRARWVYLPLYGFTVLKFVLFPLALVALILGVVGLDILHPKVKNRLVATFVVLRAPLILGSVLAIAFLTDLTPFGEQSSDVLLGWNENRGHALLSILLFAWLSVLTLVLARRLVQPTPESAQAAEWSELAESFLRRPTPIDLRRRVRLRWLVAAAAALGLVGGVLYSADLGGVGFAVGGGILLGVAGLSWRLRDLPSLALPPLGPGVVTLPAVAAAIPLVVLGLSLVKAAVPELAWAGRTEYLWWVLLGVGVQVLGLVVFATGRASFSTQVAARGWIVMGPTLALLAYLTWRIWLHPWRVADALGAFGVFALAAASALFVAYLLMWPEERVAPPSVFTVLRLRRIPVFILLMMWALFAAVLDQGGFHDVRPLEARGTLKAAGDDDGLTVEKAFDRWLRQNPAPAGTSQGGPARPLVLIAAAGGGVRAAYWTGLVLECVFRGRGADSCASADADDFPEHTVFAASGASGGSVGLASWVTRLRSGEAEADWLDHLGDDSITPTLAWSLFVDLPNAFAKFEWFADRAEVLERTWEQQWTRRDNSLGALVYPWRTGPRSRGPFAEGLFDATSDERVPLLVLTSTSVEDGCRFAVSPLDSNVGLQRVGTRIEECLTMRSFESGDPNYVKPNRRGGWALAATKDLDEYLCGDIRLSTAALLSARFPYVSPSGRLIKCGDDEGHTATYLVDGGYYDNTGSSPLIELWAALKPLVTRENASGSRCIAPFVLEIDNHYGEPPGPEPDPRPKESQVPIQTLLGTRNAQEANSRQAAAVGSSIPFADNLAVVRRGKPKNLVDRYARIYPRAHPGTRAPLGWTLSEASQKDLRKELASVQNEKEIEKARSWFAGDLVCVPVERPSR